MEYSDLTTIILVIMILTVACSGILFNPRRSDSNPEFRLKGKTYVVAGLQGTGYTYQHRSPVYTLVVMSKEDTKKWEN